MAKKETNPDTDVEAVAAKETAVPVSTDDANENVYIVQKRCFIDGAWREKDAEVTMSEVQARFRVLKGLVVKKGA